MRQGLINLVFIFSVFISFNYCLSQPVTFSEEYIEIKIFKDYAEVYGIYFFKSNSRFTEIRTLYYPFPADYAFPYPDEVKVYDVNNNQIHFTELSSGIYFKITVQPDSVTMIKVFYSQKLNSQTMKYILKTTRQWNRPLEKGEYVISLPEEYELEKLSLNPYSKELKSSRNVYYIKKENFMPEEDLIISWAGRGK